MERSDSITLGTFNLYDFKKCGPPQALDHIWEQGFASIPWAFD
jgi:hypothetical protein